MALTAHPRALLLAVTALVLAQVGLGQPSREYQLKAVLLIRFAHFVEWPAAAFPEANSPIVIGVLGQDPFGGDLDAAARSVGTIRGRPIRVERYRRVEETKACHILFISASESERMNSILAQLKGRSILTVSETEDFARRGGIIRFITAENRIRFQINLGAAQAANLKLSSKLLQWADVLNAPAG